MRSRAGLANCRLCRRVPSINTNDEDDQDTEKTAHVPETALADGENATAACVAARMARSAAYNWRDDYAEFAAHGMTLPNKGSICLRNPPPGYGGIRSAVDLSAAGLPDAAPIPLNAGGGRGAGCMAGGWTGAQHSRQATAGAAARTGGERVEFSPPDGPE
jgi:hypothetical protein